MITLLGTNISPPKLCLKMIFPFPRWDMLVLEGIFQQKICRVFSQAPTYSHNWKQRGADLRGALFVLRVQAQWRCNLPAIRHSKLPPLRVENVEGPTANCQQLPSCEPNLESTSIVMYHSYAYFKHIFIYGALLHELFRPLFWVGAVEAFPSADQCCCSARDSGHRGRHRRCHGHSHGRCHGHRSSLRCGFCGGLTAASLQRKGSHWCQAHCCQIAQELHDHQTKRVKRASSILSAWTRLRTKTTCLEILESFTRITPVSNSNESSEA